MTLIWFRPALTTMVRTSGRLFINGCTVHPNGGTLLVCESASGRILAVDLGQPGRWDVWLQDNRLQSVVPGYPGANGVKIRDGWAWISVSGRRMMVRVPIQPDGSAGGLEIAAMRLLADAFVRDVLLNLQNYI